MIAYKGFNEKLQCTLGRGTFQYEIGKTYEEDEANCAYNGFHCVEEPIRVIDWYQNGRYCVVKVEDIHEDGSAKIAAKKMTILRELNMKQLMAHEAEWMYRHPEREFSCRVEKDKGVAKKNGAVIVRGKNPIAKGQTGSWLFLVKEEKKTKNIQMISVWEINGSDKKPNVWYDAKGRAHEKIRTQKA